MLRNKACGQLGQPHEHPGGPYARKGNILKASLEPPHVINLVPAEGLTLPLRPPPERRKSCGSVA
ncbi:hypothetical protein E2C01_044225 [Portunus trituberculatus]|uniref:Uncharacterized protein n=1 Tax=Portunus trituberculatus TaxID=210409 RepID=A0A5B7FY97_PORTR|nr:hypothetical protein [Portunus trituberculatus]